jgi:hypothetical protein
VSKSAYRLPLEYKEKAIANGINLATVYKRIQRGWELERAVTEKAKPAPRHVFENKRIDGMLMAGDRPKGKKRGYAFYQDSEEELEKAIRESGLSTSEFTAYAVEQSLPSVVNGVRSCQSKIYLHYQAR